MASSETTVRDLVANVTQVHNQQAGVPTLNVREVGSIIGNFLEGFALAPANVDVPRQATEWLLHMADECKGAA